MSSSLGRNSLTMAVGTAASRITGQIRTILLAAALGTTGIAANAYQAGSMIPQVIFTLVSGGLFNAVLVPQIVRTLKAHDAEERLNKLITFSIVMLLAVTLLMTAATPLLTMLYVNGSAEMTALTNAFTLWCMPQIFFYGLYTVLGQILAANNQFGAYAWSSVGANIISCAGFTAFILLFGKADHQPLSFWNANTIALTAGTWTLGVAFQALILFWPLMRSGLRFRPSWGVRGIGLRSMSSVAVWSLGIVGITQLCNIINTQVSTNAPQAASLRLGLNQFDVAGNATYQNAYTLFILPYSLIAVSVSTALFPKLSAALAKGRVDEARRDLSESVRMVTLIMCLCTAVLIVMPVPLTRALLPSVSVPEALLIAGPLVGLSIGLPINAVFLLIQRTFYAFEDGKHPFMFCVVQYALQTVFVLGCQHFLDPQQWVAAIGWSVSLGYILPFPILLVMIRRRFQGSLDGRRIGTTVSKALLATILSMLAGLLLKTPLYAAMGVSEDVNGSMGWLSAVALCCILGIVVLAVYVLCLTLLRTNELMAALTMLCSKFSRGSTINRGGGTEATPDSHVHTRR